MKRHVLFDLRIDELSGVDVPAQEHAGAVITKRMSLIKADFSAEQRRHLAAEGDAMPDGSYPIRNGSDLHNAIQAFGRANPGDRSAVAHHIASRARALGLTDQLPTEGALAEAAGSAHHKRKETAVTDAEKQALESKIDSLTKANARLSVMAQLSDEEKVYLDRMSDDDQASTLAKGFAGARGALREAIKADEPVYTALDGTVYRKSHDSVIVNLHKRNDELATSLAKQTLATQSATLEKKAGEVMKNFACESNVKIAIMKAIDGIADEATCAAAAQAVMKADGALGLALTRHSDPGAAPPQGSPEAQLDALAKAYQKQNPKLSFEQAYGHVATFDEKGRELFRQTQGD